MFTFQVSVDLDDREVLDLLLIKILVMLQMLQMIWTIETSMDVFFKSTKQGHVNHYRRVHVLEELEVVPLLILEMIFDMEIQALSERVECLILTSHRC